MAYPRRTLPKNFDPIRWQVERERRQIPDALPRTPFKEAQSVSTALDGVLKKIGVNFSSLENRIQNDWIEIVGADLARRTMPGKLANGTLTIFVTGSVWLSELKRNGQANVIKRVNETLGATTVRRVVWLAAPHGR